MHHMLLGLVGDGKMSKSVPDSAIYMDDSFEEIQRKIMNASCPEPGAESGNPILEYYKYIVFGAIEQEMISTECLGSVVVLPYDRDGSAADCSQFANYEELETAYVEGRIAPHVLKSSLVHYIDSLIAPSVPISSRPQSFLAYSLMCTTYDLSAKRPLTLRACA